MADMNSGSGESTFSFMGQSAMPAIASNTASPDDGASGTRSWQKVDKTPENRTNRQRSRSASQHSQRSSGQRRSPRVSRSDDQGKLEDAKQAEDLLERHEEHLKEMIEYERQNNTMRIELNSMRNTISFVEHRSAYVFDEYKEKWSHEMNMMSERIQNQHHELIEAAQEDMGAGMRIDELTQQRDLSEDQAQRLKEVVLMMRENFEQKLVELQSQSERRVHDVEMVANHLQDHGMAMQQEYESQIVRTSQEHAHDEQQIHAMYTLKIMSMEDQTVKLEVDNQELDNVRAELATLKAQRRALMDKHNALSNDQVANVIRIHDLNREKDLERERSLEMIAKYDHELR